MEQDYGKCKLELCPMTGAGCSCSVNSGFAIQHLLLLFIYLFFAVITWCLAKVKQNLLGPGWQKWQQTIATLRKSLNNLHLWVGVFVFEQTLIIPSVPLISHCRFLQVSLITDLEYCGLCRAGSCHVCVPWHTRPFRIPNKADWCRKEMASHRQICFLNLTTTVTTMSAPWGKAHFLCKITSVR